MRDARPVERLARLVDALLTLVEGVVRRGVAHVPTGVRNPLGERRGRVEDRVARRRRRGHGRLHVAERKVRAGDIALDLAEERREVIARAAGQRLCARPDRRMDQQIAARLDGELDRVGLERQLPRLPRGQVRRVGAVHHVHHEHDGERQHDEGHDPPPPVGDRRRSRHRRD